ncbi:MAG: hypothetical protein OXC08_06830 [Thiotrichales bacterium]|nr:hypothetical protein [Thiotrichales bacterium]
MNVATFDTHAAVTALRDAGLDEAPAVAIVNTVRDAAGTDHSDLATKADLATAIADLKADMLKVAIGVAIGIVIANATLTAVFVFGAMRLLQP